MDAAIRICYEAQPQQADVDMLREGLSAFNAKAAKIDDYQPLAFFLRDASNEVVGGVVGATYWAWFELEFLWVREDLRGRGFGQQLLAAAEAEAIRRGCRRVFLDTFSFQAPAFYRARGYDVFGELPDFPRGQPRYFMVKDLDRG